MLKLNRSGFTLVEIMVVCIIFPILVLGMTTAYESLNQSYRVSKQYNEMYAVLSACPEIDRALEYNSLTSTSNCYPNNTFRAEGGGSATITYTPAITVTNTEALAGGDSLKSIPDSKVVKIKVPFLDSNAPDLQLKILITRNGIGQI